MQTLFPDGIPEGQWTEFAAEGFDDPVSGIVFDGGRVTTGVPLGGLGTGSIDLNGNGCFGRTSIFNHFAPPHEMHLPFLGVAVGEKSFCLTTVDLPGVNRCRRIRYWGHYPVADLEYETDAPVAVGLRAWAPFLLGDAQRSNTPAAFFEVHAKNRTAQRQILRVVLAFPGPPADRPSSAECASVQLHTEGIGGACVEWREGSYVLATPLDSKVEVGGSIGGLQWNEIAAALPQTAADDPGRSVCAEFVLDAGASLEIPFVLAWFVPRWLGSPAHSYRHAYAERFRDARDVAKQALTNRLHWRKQIFSWQTEIYRETEFPVWLRDQMVNGMHTITRDAFWASQSIPSQRWYGDAGLFGLTESPRTTPHVCNPSDWYGNLPLVFFFPEQMRALLRAYVHYQLPTGEVPLGIGEKADFAGQPVYQVMHLMNSCVHIHLIDRLWQRDRDPAILQEFYPTAVQALSYMRSLLGDDDAGLPELDADPIPNQFYGDWPWYGLSIHVAGFWIAAIRMMERMAAVSGDTATESLCREWGRAASQTVERKLWNGSAYLLYRDDRDGRRSETILANQLVGQWCARLHSLPGLYPEDHIHRALDLVLEVCGRPTAAGLVNARKRDGSPDTAGGRQSTGIFTGECLAVAATMILEGRAAEGVEMARRMMAAIVLDNNAGWNLPNILNAAGEIVHGDDFYQMMILWAVALALRGEGIQESCAAGGLVDRIVRSCGDPL
jgi:uncharacterized protein (DUF608 family)